MFLRLVLLVFFSTCSPLISATYDTNSFHPGDIITRDVAIIGGGSSGTYSAISLRDKGKSVIVIEKKGRIGGHAETYIDPGTGTPIDIGVIIFHNITVVRNYFKRFNIPLTVYGSDGEQPMRANYDLKTGNEVFNVSTPTPEETAAAFAKYAEQLQKYPRLDEGMFLPDPVPEDLYMPFGEFAKKYGIEEMIPILYMYNPGLGDILTVPTIEQMRAWGFTSVSSLINGFLTTAHHNSSELYSFAQSELLSASSLLLNSTVEQTTRENGRKGVELIVRTPTGKKLIRAKKLLIAIPPKLDILRPFDLSAREKNVFGKLINGAYYTSIVKNTGLPSSLSIYNHLPSTPYNLPNLPGPYSITSTEVPDLKIAFYGGPRSSSSFPISDDAVKADIISSIKRLQKENPEKFEQTEPEFVEFSSHTPFYLQARPEDTKRGFYERMYGLQGERNTYWTGAAWRAQDSSLIWRYCEDVVLPQVLGEL